MVNTFRLRPYLFLAVFSLILAACASAVSPQTTPRPTGIEATAEPSTNPTETDLLASPTAEKEDPLSSENPFAGVNLRFNPSFWPDTDFTKHSVDYSEFLSGGPPPDGIPAIDSPRFESISDAAEWLGEDWPIMFFEWNDDVRAYPLAILIYHEIVNDEVGGREVALTFCPLCNATIAFDRNLPDGRVLDFGTTGNLRNSDLVMYDRQTKSWWQQFTGEALVGELTGTQLDFLPSQIISFADFMANHPDGKVLSRDTGHARSYGRNPYTGYDTINSKPFLFDGDLDGRLPPVERVVAIEINGIDKAYPFSALQATLVINDEVDGQSLVVFWKEGTISTFGNSDLETGSTGVFSSRLDGQILTFQAVDGGFEDEGTGSVWNLLGEAIEGPLAGQKLDRIVSAEHFWFAWAAFRPDTVIWTPAG